jgi:hypothetical protein
VSFESAVYAGRAAAERMMLDAGQALRPTGEWETVDIGLEDDVEVEVTQHLFDSRCKVQTREVQARESEVGGRTAVEVRMELHLPADTPPLAVGDVWEFTAAHPLSLSTVGQRLRVTSPVAGTLKTARRYSVEEVVT